MRYRLDSDVLIAANTGPFPMAHAHGFWKWLENEINTDRIVAAERVFNEVVKGRSKKDDLANWMDRRKKSNLCIKSSKHVDSRVRAVNDYVNDNSQYPTHQKLAFYQGADAWLIAHAWVDNGTVVSNESDRFPKSQRVRIPDVCHTVHHA
jgi:hypothetical protein